MLHISKKELDYTYPKVSVENCKNTKTDNSWKEMKCICGSTRIGAKIVVVGEGAGDWVLIRCRRCNKTLYYNGA